MPLSKRTGNMYDWVTHTWSCLQGQCPHECSYCYVKNGHWTKNSPAYQGEPRLEPNFDNVNLGKGKTIFVAHTSDLFAEGVPRDVVLAVLGKCLEYSGNHYIFQTKNPGNAWQYIEELPVNCTIGTTIETNMPMLLQDRSQAPPPRDRAEAIGWFRDGGFETFITIEPIMGFHLSTMMGLIREASPNWINIGADSKNCNLPEPSWEEVQDLIHEIKHLGIEIREKSNLDRLRRLV